MRCIASGLLLALAGCASSPPQETPVPPPVIAPSASCIAAVPGADAGVLRACTEREQLDAAAGRATNYEPFRSVVRALARADRQQAARTQNPATQGVGWNINCAQLRAEAIVYCAARFTEPGLPGVIVGYAKGLDGRINGPTIAAGHLHDCPGYAQTVRVDRNAPIGVRRLARRDENLPGQAAIVRQMDDGVEISVTSYTWPQCSPRSVTLPIAGFRDAHNRLRAAIAEARAE